MSKCPEMIGYVGDVRILAESGYEEVDSKEIEAWVRRSNSVEFATLFYSHRDIWEVSKIHKKLLKINPNLQIKKISDIQKFIDYVDTGMDRGENPVKEITMINVQSTWEKGSIDTYIKEAYNAEQKTVIKVLLDNESVEAQISQHHMSVSETIDKVKDHYHYEEAKTIGDEIIGTSEKVKGNIDHSKDRVKKIFSKGLDGYDAPKSINFRMKGDKYIDQKGFLHKESVGNVVKQNMTANNMSKAVGGAGHLLGAYSDFKAISSVGDAAENLSKTKKETNQEYEDCIKDAGNFKSINFAKQDRCFDIRNKKSIINLSTFISKASGHPETKKYFLKAGGL